MTASSERSPDLGDEVPRALVQPRQSSEEPVAGPSFLAAATSPSGKKTRFVVQISVSLLVSISKF